MVIELACCIRELVQANTEVLNSRLADESRKAANESANLRLQLNSTMLAVSRLQVVAILFLFYYGDVFFSIY